MIQIRHFEKENDYNMIAGWWQAHGFPVVHPGVLPATGLICEIEGKPTAAAWLMMDNSCGFAMVAWAVTNPGNIGRESHTGLSHVAACLIEHARGHGYISILNTCTQQSIAKVFTRQGFQTTDQGVIHQLAILPLCQS